MLLRVKKDLLSPNQMIEVSKAPKIIVYFDGQNYYAFNGVCPHAKWPLDLGRINNTTLTCGGHSWEFEITDGKCTTNPGRDLKIYKIQTIGNEIVISD